MNKSFSRFLQECDEGSVYLKDLITIRCDFGPLGYSVAGEAAFCGEFLCTVHSLE